MKTFGCGDFVCNASSMEEGLAMQKYFETRNSDRDLKVYLEAHKYFHDFDYNRFCKNCDMQLSTYYYKAMTRSESINPREHICKGTLIYQRCNPKKEKVDYVTNCNPIFDP